MFGLVPHKLNSLYLTERNVFFRHLNNQENYRRKNQENYRRKNRNDRAELNILPSLLCLYYCSNVLRKINTLSFPKQGLNNRVDYAGLTCSQRERKY